VNTCHKRFGNFIRFSAALLSVRVELLVGMHHRPRIGPARTRQPSPNGTVGQRGPRARNGACAARPACGPRWLAAKRPALDGVQKLLTIDQVEHLSCGGTPEA
jgi:hypothetical protein